MRARLVLQLALATVAAMLSLYFWLRAIGGEPGGTSLRTPMPLAKNRIVATFVTPRRLRLHVRKKRVRKHVRTARPHVAVSLAAAVRPAAIGASAATHTGGSSSR